MKGGTLIMYHITEHINYYVDKFLYRNLNDRYEARRNRIKEERAGRTQRIRVILK